MYFTTVRPKKGQGHAVPPQQYSDLVEESRWIGELFSPEQGQPRDYLYRRDDQVGLGYLIVSQRMPRCRDPLWEAVARDVAVQVETGTLLDFKLRANPAMPYGRGERGEAADVVSDYKQALLGAHGQTSWRDWQDPAKPKTSTIVQQVCTDWLRKRSVDLGFELVEDAVRAFRYTPRSVRAGSSKLVTVDYAGRLRVTDGAAFERTLAVGIGRARTFGCGLLVIPSLFGGA